MMTREQAAQALADAGYEAAAPAVLAEAGQWPCRWAYTPDRHRAAVHHMPADTWTVLDCGPSEDTIARLARRYREWS